MDVERFLERRACPLCGAAHHDVLHSAPYGAPQVFEFIASYYGGRIARADVDGALFEVRRCAKCGFLWQAYHLDAAGSTRLYEEWISPEESLAKKTRADVTLYEGYAREAAAIAQRLRRKPADVSVLDFGMGWGAWCRVAQAFGYRVTGFEPSQRRRDHARAHGIAAIAAIEALGHYDFVNCHQVLEHVPDPLATLARLAAALAPGGQVRISVPDGHGVEAALRSPAWRAAKDALHPLEHINCFTGRTLHELAARAGLRPAPDPAPARSRPRELARRMRASLRQEPRGTTGYFARAVD
jgi:2-polyprenyl-3-methyl-5-hydroxy-6-metoxy-1,4-benzoquinol methylase